MLDPLATCAVLYARADMKARAGALREETLWLLGDPGCRAWDALPSLPAVPRAFRHDPSGWHVLVSAEQPPRTLIFDAGPLGALSGGHGHADALSVQSIHDGRPWLTDPGAGRYPHQTPERDAFRSTLAHSTLTVDGRSQAVPRGSFGWDRLPASVTERFLDAGMLDLVVARHHGYDNLPAPVLHRRWALLFDHGLIFVRDIAAGAGRHRFEQTWRLGPDFRIAALEPEEVTFTTPDGDLFGCVAPADATWAREIFDGDWSPCYGVWQGAPVVRFVADADAPCERAVALVPGDAAPRKRRLDQLLDGRGEGLSVYCYDDERASLTLCFHDQPGEWTYQSFRSDAQLLVWERRGEARRALAAYGSFLEVDGQTLYRETAECFEWSS